MSPRVWGQKLTSLFRRSSAEQEMSREMAAHLGLIEEEFLRRGLSLEEAKLAARRAYGGMEQAKELHRDARSFLFVEQTLQDMRHAGRALRKSPGFFAVAMLSLAFGIGVNTAIFTLVNGILLKSLDVPDPEKIVQLEARMDQFTSSGFSFPTFRELRRQTAIFSSVVGFSSRRGVLDQQGTPRSVEFQLVTGAYFEFFLAQPWMGRLINEEDDRNEGGPQVCVISYRAWHTYFGADPGVVGKIARINNVDLQVVGVAPQRFVGAELQRRFDFWAPTAAESQLAGAPREASNRVWLRILGRIRPEVSFAEAQARLKAASPAIEQALPANRANTGSTYQLRDGSKGYDTWRTQLRRPLLILMGAVTLVLLVACANLANLLLARASERQHEFAIKLSLGINRWRLMRQLVVESLMLTIAGGVAGVLIATELTKFLLGMYNSAGRTGLTVAPDATVLVFTLLTSLVTALVAGLYPAWKASSTDATSRLRGSGSNLQRNFVRRALIVAQVTFTLTLLFGASLFVQSLRNLKTVDLGFDIDRVLTVDVGQQARLPGQSGKPSPIFSEVLERLRQSPSIDSVALSNPTPLSGATMSDEVTARTTDGGSRKKEGVRFMLVSSRFMSTMRIPLLRGRDFTADDRDGAPAVAIINERLASVLWPSGNPLGQVFEGFGKKMEVVGVVANSKYASLRESNRETVYMPFEQLRLHGGTLVIRCRAPLSQVETEARRMVKTVAPSFQVSGVSSMELMRDNQIAQDRLLTFLSMLFGFLGAALALVGIYGLIAYSVTRRTREIGIRISLGAQKGGLYWLFVREAALLIAFGSILGLPLALGLARFVKTLLFEVSPSNPTAILLTLLLLLMSGLLAAALPARRAVKVSPVSALRYD